VDLFWIQAVAMPRWFWVWFGFMIGLWVLLGVRLWHWFRVGLGLRLRRSLWVRLQRRLRLTQKL
jgi:hypothetical protein